MKNLNTYIRHWDSRFSWIEIPMLELQQVRQVLSPFHRNSRVSGDLSKVYLDESTDGKRFLKHRMQTFEGLPYPPVLVEEICDGTISPIRRYQILE